MLRICAATENGQGKEWGKGENVQGRKNEMY